MMSPIWALSGWPGRWFTGRVGEAALGPAAQRRLRHAALARHLEPSLERPPRVGRRVEQVGDGKREEERAYQRPCLLVVTRGGYNRDIHAAHFFNLIEIDLRKDQLLTHANCVIATAIKGLRRNTAKVAHAGQGQRNQPVQKLVHTISPQCHHATDGNSFA
jgi:hypothetical protein